MRSNLLQFVVIFLLFQCIQGTLRHFNTKRRPEDIPEEYLSKDYGNVFSRSDINVDRDSNELPQLRIRKQNAGGDPESNTTYLTYDDHQYARVSYLGEGSKVIFLLTYDQSSSGYIRSSRLYRSLDYGLIFRRVYTQSYRLDNAIYRFPNSTTVMFADTVRSTIYVTTDEGETFTSYNTPVDPTTLKIHPTMPGWILGHDPDQGDLMYSVNFGVSWSTVARIVHSPGYVSYSRYDFTWGEPGIDWDSNNPSQSDITKVFYGVIDPNSSGNDEIIYVATNFGGGYTSRVFDNNLGYVDTFILDGIYIFADKYICDDGDELQLYVSYMRNPFNLTRVPTTFSHYFYFVGSYRPSQALIIIEHETHYNLYLSDETGSYYSLSLQDLAVGNYIDFEIIDSINGTIIANQFVSVGGYPRNQTLITFNNGAQWQKIAAPTNPLSCTLPTCSLHFHIRASVNYRRIGLYSRTSAPGIIIAHGNTGSYLTNNGSVYISRDGGLTWIQRLDYTWHVEIIDHGGLLVAAKDNHQDYSRTIKYSCDEGMSWIDFNFINNRIVVWGIITEPGETTTQVLLFGTRTQSSRSDWIVTHVNFTSIFTRTCESSDYENWTVSDGRNGDQQCLLGETRIIERRKPSVCCWNSRQYERVISTTPCQCTAADFECEWGYYRNDSSECTLNTEYGPKSDCLTGYRKIAGDVCVGGVTDQYLPPNDCVLDDNNSSRFNDCAVTHVPVTHVPDSSHNNTIKNDSSSSSTVLAVTPVPDNGYNNTSKNDSNITAGKSSGNDNNNGSVIAISVSVAVVISIGALIIVLYLLRLLSKLGKTTSVAMPTDGGARAVPNVYEESSTVQDKPVVGGSMNYKSLKEDKVDDI